MSCATEDESVVVASGDSGTTSYSRESGLKCSTTSKCTSTCATWEANSKTEGLWCLLSLRRGNCISSNVFNSKDNFERCFWRRNLKGYGRTNTESILLNWYPIEFFRWNLQLPLNNLLSINYVFLPRVQPTTISNIMTKVLTMGAEIRKPIISHLHTKRETFPLDHNLMKQLLRKIHLD